MLPVQSQTTVSYINMTPQPDYIKINLTVMLISPECETMSSIDSVFGINRGI